MTIEQKYILFTMYQYAKEEYDNYVKQHGEMYPFTMERHGVMKAYRNVIEVLHLTEDYEHFEQELNTALSPTEREQQAPEEV
jgi:hypothetical protein